MNKEQSELKEPNENPAAEPKEADNEGKAEEDISSPSTDAEKEQRELLSMAQNELEELKKNPATELKETYNEGKAEEDIFSLSTDAEIRRRILQATLSSANSIYAEVARKEKSKNKWRAFFIVFCCLLLTLTLFFVGFIIIVNGMGKLSVEKEIIIALLTYIVANFFTILIFMVKYVHSSQYLETFRTVTHKLLDYVLADKNSSSSLSGETIDLSNKEKGMSEKKDRPAKK